MSNTVNKDQWQHIDSMIVELLKTTEAEVKLGHRKLYWDKKQWVVRKRKTSSDLYLQIMYEGNDELEAVTALKDLGEIREIEI